MQRRVFIGRTMLTVTALAGAGLAAGPGQAATVAFNEAAFKAAQLAGKPIMVAVHASWCPICAKQKPILSELMASPQFKDVTLMMVDFDSQKDICRQFGVQKQSTLIAFHGGAERDRSTGITDPDAIKALLLKTEV